MPSACCGKPASRFNADCRDLSLVCYLLSPTGGGRTFAQAAGEYLGTGTPADAALPALDAKAYPASAERAAFAVRGDRKTVVHCWRIWSATGSPSMRTPAAFGAQLEQGVREAEAHYLDLAGRPLTSTRPSSSVLFEKLACRITKKNRSGYSTDADVLERLRDKHPVVELILYYRQLSKLKSTYADGLLKVIDPADGRIHTTFRQTLTQTGRLSSVEPNLQNIPCPHGAWPHLPEVFVAAPGCLLVDADYSGSRRAARARAHLRRTKRSSPPSTPARTSTPSPPRRCSASLGASHGRGASAQGGHFGIIYGIGDYSLSEDIGVSMREAKACIRKLFRKNTPRIRARILNFA